MKLKVDKRSLCELKHSIGLEYSMPDSTAVSVFVDILVDLTNTVFVKLTNIFTNIETAVLSTTSDPISIEQVRRQYHKVAMSLSLGIGYVCCSKSTYSINFERNPVNHQLYMRPSIRLGTEAKEKVYSMKVWRYP